MDRQISIIKDSICKSSRLGESKRKDWAALVIGIYKNIPYYILSANTDVVVMDGADRSSKASALV